MRGPDESTVKRLVAGARKHGITPANCPHCAYDRKFPETAMGGWIYPGNNAPYSPCPMCNADGSWPRS